MQRCTVCKNGVMAGEFDNGPCEACWDVELLYFVGDFEGAALAAGEDWDF
jgi:hypothetical protein